MSLPLDDGDRDALAAMDSPAALARLREAQAHEARLRAEHVAARERADRAAEKREADARAAAREAERLAAIDSREKRSQRVDDHAEVAIIEQADAVCRAYAARFDSHLGKDDAVIALILAGDVDRAVDRAVDLARLHWQIVERMTPASSYHGPRVAGYDAATEIRQTRAWLLIALRQRQQQQ